MLSASKAGSMKNALEALVDHKVDADILKLAPDFIRNRQQDIQTLKSAYSMRDYETIAKICHKLKGFSSPFGFSDLEVLAHNLESASKSQNLQDLESHFSNIQSYIATKSEKLARLSTQ